MWYTSTTSPPASIAAAFASGRATESSPGRDSGSLSTNPTTATVAPDALASLSTTARFASMNPSLRTRSSGGYPVTASSGRRTTSADWPSAHAMASRIFSSLPPRSPTIRSSCAPAILSLRVTDPPRSRRSDDRRQRQAHRVFQRRWQSPH